MAKKTYRIAAGLMVVLMALSFVGRAAARAPQYFYDFQKELSPWTAGIQCYPVPGADSVLRPCDATGVLQLRTENEVDSYAALYDQGASNVYMQSSYAVPSGSQIVEVEFDAFDAKNAKRLTPIIHAGWLVAQDRLDFAKIGVPLSNGRQHLVYRANIVLTKAQAQESKFVVAIGFMNLDGMIDTQVGGIDNVRIAFYGR